MIEFNDRRPRIIHDNGNHVHFADGVTVSRQDGTVTHPNWPDVMTPKKGQSRHFDAAQKAGEKQ